MKKHLLFKFLLTFFIALFISVGWVNGQQTLIISEVADPGDVYQARFVEIYNATSATIDLTGWQIRRYAGTNLTSGDVDLTGTIASGATYTIAYNATDFNTNFGFAPDVASGNISGNGDDTYELFNGTSVVDIYGEVGVDGTGDPWEYLDTRAVRNTDIGTANTTWTASEWTIDASADVADCSPGSHTCDYPPVDTPPVATFDPADGETFIAIDKTITITFDEKIYKSDGTTEIVDGDLSTLITFKETDASGSDVTATMTYSNADPFVITIDPTSNLTNGQDYYVAFGSVYDDAAQENTGENVTFTTIPTNYIVLTDPVGGEKYYAGDNPTVTWDFANVTTVDIKVYVPATDTWDLLADDTPSDGTEGVTIPTDAGYSDQYRLAIVDISDPTVADTSDVFTVISTPTINDIQSDNDGDLSNYDGHIVKTSGIITFSGTGEYIIQDGAGSWNGIYVYDYGFDNTSVEGDNVTIEAEVANYLGVTQLANVVSLTVNSSGNALPAITAVTTAGLTEEYEGVYVKVINAQVTNESVATGKFEIDDGSGALIVDDNLYYDAEAGITIDRDLTITGIGHYANEFQLLPRSTSDIVSATDTVGTTEYAIDQVGLAITDIPFSTTLAVFEANFEAADTATFDVFDADGTTPATVLDDTKKLIVTAADGITKAIYTITRNAVLTDATVTSSVYTVDDGLETITNIPYGTDLATFSSNIIPPEQGSFTVYESNGTTPATVLATGCILRGTAEDGITTKDYTITVSDIVPDTDSNVGEPTTQVAAATIAVVDGDEDAEAFEVFSFDINDIGTADGTTTNVSQIVLYYGPNMTIDFATEIDSGYFKVDGIAIDLDGEPVIGADSVAFPVLAGEISVPDGGSVNVVMNLILEPTVADGKVIQFMIDADQHRFETTGISSEFATTFAADVVGNDITIDVVATDLSFSTQPTNVYIGESITPAVVVEAIDANGNIDTGYTTDISITATGATLVGTPVSTTTTAGVATFDALSFSDAGTGVTITAASGTLNSEISSTFNVTEEATSDLFFSEYIEPDGGNNKALEIYNGTGAEVDLANYVIRINSNGSAWTSFMDFPVGTTVADGDVYVITHAEADAELLAVTDTAVLNPYGSGTSYVAVFNGNDARALCKVIGTDTTIIDIIGEESVDSAWSVAGTDYATKNHTLIRKSSITIGNANWTASAGTNTDDSEWIVKDANYFDDLGVHGPKSGTDIISFDFVGQSTGAADIDDVAHTVAIEVAYGTSPTALVATFTLSDGASAKVGATDQVSSTTANDFTSPVTYSITAEDETVQDWTVTVTVATTQSDAKEIESFTVEGMIGTATIESGAATVNATVEYGTDITNLKPIFTISALATIADTTIAKDFTNPQTYTVTAEDASEKVWTVTITEEAATDVADIAALRALYTETNENMYRITGEVTFTYATDPHFYIQDGTAAILIYNGNDAITTAYNIGDNVQNLVGIFDTFGGNMQFKLMEDPGTAVSTGNTITAQTVTIPEFAANYTDYDAELIKLEDVTFTETGTFEASTNYTLNNASDQVALRTNFSSADYIGENIPTETMDITAIAGIYNGTVQVYPRALSDMVVATGISNPDGIVSMNIYPNPSNGLFTLEMNASKAGTFSVEIINIQGQVVFTKQINQDGFYKDQIDISNETSGIYYIRIYDGNEMKVSKIMIQ